MVDWSLARRIAGLAGATDGPADVGIDVVASAKRLEPDVAAYTGLDPHGSAPPAELVDRASWADANLTTFSHILEPVADRMSQRLGRAGPMAGPLRMGAGATIAAEAGLITGYMSQRVLGQFELSLIQPEAPTRLLFVAPNLNKAVTELDAEREAFIDWIVLHELTHVVQFTGVPWLREHLGGLLRAYLDSVDVQIQAGAAGGAPSMAHNQGGGGALPGGRPAVDARHPGAGRSLPRGRPHGAHPDARAARPDGPPPARHGGHRGLLRARHGRARRDAGAGLRHASRRDGPPPAQPLCARAAAAEAARPGPEDAPV